MDVHWFGSISIKGCCDVVVVLAIELESDELNILGDVNEEDDNCAN